MLSAEYRSCSLLSIIIVKTMMHHIICKMLQSLVAIVLPFKLLLKNYLLKTISDKSDYIELKMHLINTVFIF